MVLQYNMSPLLVHDSMFTDLVENQITDDQKKMWMDDIRSYNIVGTYAQTELGHGKTSEMLIFISLRVKSTPSVFQTYLADNL